MTERLTRFGRDLRSRLERFFDPPAEHDAEPLEILQAVLDAVERQVQPVGRGQRVFPFCRMTVRLSPPADERAALEAVFAGLERRVRDRLDELQCEAGAVTQVRTIWLKKAPAHWAPGQVFGLDFAREPEGRPPGDDEAAAPAVRIKVVAGAATEAAYTLAAPVIAIGRTAAVNDEAGRVRRNSVVFLDSVDGVTETVGRAHARLRFDAASREYRLFDDGSSNGTSIVRCGETIAVPPRDPRGVRVRSGDEIHLGRAVLRVRLEELQR